MIKEPLQIIKIGGNIINNQEALAEFLLAFSKIDGKKILVHGGGKRATELAAKLGVEAKMVDGRRITDKSNLEIVTMVYAGLLNKNMTAQLQSFGSNAIGLSGADANVIRAHKREVKDLDYGFAGDVDEINEGHIALFLENNLVPVFCAITHDKMGQLLNTNADTIASELAIAMSSKYEVSLIYIFEKNGVLRSIEDDQSVIEQINLETYKELVSAGVISEGMLPKVHNCFEGLKKGVSKVIIGNPTIISNTNQKFTTLVL